MLGKSKPLNKRFLASLILIGILVVGVAYASAPIYLVKSTNTVTQVIYPTSTSTVTTTGAGPTETVTGQPVEILTTATVTGTQTYTATSTTTVAGPTTTVTSTMSSDYYAPFWMYWVWSNNTGFWRSFTPWSGTYGGSDTVTETPSGFSDGTPYTGSVAMTINQVSTKYNDLGFYYEFQNLNLGMIATGGYSITISGSGTYGVNLWLNPQSFVWGPTASPSVEKYSGLGATGAYGLGPSSPSTISASTPFTSWSGSLGTCSPGNYTPAQLVSTCGLSPTTPFALWIGVGPVNSGTVTATVTAISSSPYP